MDPTIMATMGTKKITGITNTITDTSPITSLTVDTNSPNMDTSPITSPTVDTPTTRLQPTITTRNTNLTATTITGTVISTMITVMTMGTKNPWITVMADTISTITIQTLR